MFDFASSELVVCTAEATHTPQGSGQGEILVGADLNGDGTDEILTGGTTVSAAGVDVAAIVGGVLDYVKVTDGDRLELREGRLPGGYVAHGCADFTGDGQPQVAIITAVPLSASDILWERSIYRIEGHEHVLVASDSGTLDPSGAVEPLTSPAFTDVRGDPCWTPDGP